MEKLIVAPSNELLNERLHNPHGTDGGFVARDGVEHQWENSTGWYFGAGNPEFWKYSEALIKPGGKVLDLGMGEGRGSIFFALHGMDVTGYEINPKTVESVNEMAEELSGVMPFRMRAIEADMTVVEFERESQDIVLMDAMVHLPSKEVAFELMEKAYMALKPVGYLFFRGAGKESSAWHEMLYQPGARQTSDDVITHPCMCSGDLQDDPSLFFDQTDILRFFALNGANVVHSQLLPEEGRMNIMYGEDFNRDQHVWVGGMITLLAQKPDAVS